ncbi:MAG TPA: DUF1569 domain-containing protein [Tepidisphaeraceae bacterium]|jgi:hypothetical protein|nr:DUF1569 domain-containing protein [Tepidisphaeraceae bacterium]
MTIERRQIRYATPDDLIADVRGLCAGGYDAAGKWSLGQVCWHLNKSTSYMMSAGPHVEPSAEQQAAGQQILKGVLAKGEIPRGVEAPERALPPAEVGEGAIDEFVATMERFKSFPGPFAPHRLFGRLTSEDARRLVLIHAAHHMSHLVPAKSR